jgi:hypothetical protein
MDPRGLNWDSGPRYDKIKSSDTNVTSFSGQISTTLMHQKNTSSYAETDRESKNKIHDQRGVWTANFLNLDPHATHP